MTLEEIKKGGFDKYLAFFNEFPLESVSDWDLADNYIEHLKLNFEKIIKYANDFLSKTEDYNLDLETHYNSILEVIEIATNGFHSKAYYKLSNILENTKSFLENINPIQLAFTLPSGNTSLRMHKMRMDCPEAKHKDFFHIPFNKLHLTKNNRFSLQGVPCIYYGSTIYVCWEELDRPIIENTYVVRAQLKLKFLDLSITPSYVAIDYNPQILVHVTEEKLSNFNKNRAFNFCQYLLMWPLIFASSVKVKYRNSIFRPEYLLPHLILEWVKQNPQYDGIKYLSTKTTLLTPKSIQQITNFYNCVVPVKNISGKEYSEELSNSISWTEPINYNILKLLNALPIQKYRENEITNDITSRFNNYRYDFTIFGQIEKILLSMNDHQLEYNT